MMNEIKQVLISSPALQANNYTIQLEIPVKGVYKAELLYACINADTPSSNVVVLDIPELRSPTSWAVPKSGAGSSMSPFAIIPINGISPAIFQKNMLFDAVIEYPNPIPRLDRITVRLLYNDTNTLVKTADSDNNYFIVRLHTTKMDHWVNDPIKF
jgi:hypothetical protein